VFPSSGTRNVGKDSSSCAFLVRCVVLFIRYRHLLFIILNLNNNRASENRYMTAFGMYTRVRERNSLYRSVPERSLTGIKCYRAAH